MKFVFQIVMEYCGAGSVSDIMKLRNKTVSIRSCRVTNNNSAAQENRLKLMLSSPLVHRRTNCVHIKLCLEGFRVLALTTKDSQVMFNITSIQFTFFQV